MCNPGEVKQEHLPEAEPHTLAGQMTQLDKPILAAVHHMPGADCKPGAGHSSLAAAHSSEAVPDLVLLLCSMKRILPLQEQALGTKCVWLLHGDDSCLYFSAKQVYASLSVKYVSEVSETCPKEERAAER